MEIQESELSFASLDTGATNAQIVQNHFVEAAVTCMVTKLLTRFFTAFLSGEYKLWIYRNCIISMIKFHLCVELSTFQGSLSHLLWSILYHQREMRHISVESLSVKSNSAAFLSTSLSKKNEFQGWISRWHHQHYPSVSVQLSQQFLQLGLTVASLPGRGTNFFALYLVKVYFFKYYHLHCM